MFVGEQHQAALERLVKDWSAVRAMRKPRIVFLSAPLGWGKTRVIQEAYERIAASDWTNYWPKKIVEDDLGTLSKLTLERKRLQPSPFVVTTNPPFVWLAVHADPSEFARPEDAYRVLIEQLRPHLYGLLREKRLTAAAARTLGRVLTTFLPVPADVETFLDLGDAMKDMVHEWRAGTSTPRIAGSDSTEQQAADFWNLMTTVWGPDGNDGPSIFLAIEDAHFLSPTSIQLLQVLLTSNLPVLVVAAGWPTSGTGASRTEPFSSFVDSNPPGLRVDSLDQLRTSEVRSLIRSLHPETAEEVVVSLAERTGGNPYALRLALIRLDAERGRPISAAVDEFNRTSFTIHSELEWLLHQIPLPASRSLASAAALGFRLPRDVAIAGANVVPGASLELALSTDWVRFEDPAEELIAFLEPLRQEVADRFGLEVFTKAQRLAILHDALREVRRLLALEPPHRDHALVCDVHIGLAQAGVETDASESFRSAAALLRDLRRREAKATLREVIRRIESIKFTNPPPNEVSAEFAVEKARSLRFCNQRPSPETAQAVDQAINAMDGLWEMRPDLAVTILAEKGRIHRDADARDLFDPDIARKSVDAALAIVAIHELPSNVLHNIRACEYGVVSTEGDRDRATDLALAEMNRATLPNGDHTPASIESLNDAGFYATRAGDEDFAVELSRIALQERRNLWGTESHPRVAIAKKDLAIRLMRLGRDDAIAEAFEICGPTYLHLEAAFGPDDTSSLNARSARGYSAMRHGLVLWRHGNQSESERLFMASLSDATAVLAGRHRKNPDSDHLISQERECLARALCGDPAGVDDALERLDLRVNQRAQSLAFAEVRWLIQDIAECMRVLGQSERADALEDRLGTEEG